MSNQNESYADLNGVEVFRAGKHHEDEEPYTLTDLDNIVTKFNELDFKPPLKAGHSGDGPGMPALGWVKALRRQGEKLVADFTDIPDRFFTAIKDRMFDGVSSEVFVDLYRNGKKHGKVLKAVAVLGAEIPAVWGLKPLAQTVQEQYFSISTGGRFTQSTALPLTYASSGQSSDDDIQGLLKEFSMADENKLDDLLKRLDTIEATSKANADALKAEQEARAKEATEYAAKLSSANATIEKMNESLKSALSAQMKGDELREAVASLADSEAEKAARQYKATAEAEEKRRRQAEADRDAAETKLRESDERIKKLESTTREHSTSELVKTCRIPSLRPFIAQFIDLSTREANVQVYSTDGKKMKALDAVTDLIKHVNDNAARLFSVISNETDPNERRDRLPDAAQEVDRRVKVYRAEHTDVDYRGALKHVLEADPALKQAYGDREGRAAA